MSPSISDAAYRSMVEANKRALVRMFSDMPRGMPIDVTAVRMWARGFIEMLVSHALAMLVL
jgi:hypothetical protein